MIIALVIGCLVLPAALLMLIVVGMRRSTEEMERQLKQLRRQRDLERWSNDW